MKKEEIKNRLSKVINEIKQEDTRLYIDVKTNDKNKITHLKLHRFTVEIKMDEKCSVLIYYKKVIVDRFENSNNIEYASDLLMYALQDLDMKILEEYKNLP